jgi:adenylate kinase
MARKNPNIVITGTPGVGKTTHAEQLAQATGFQHISVNQIVKDEGFHEGKDEETGSWIVDEDKVRTNIRKLRRNTNPTLTAPRPPRNSSSQ